MYVCMYMYVCICMYVCIYIKKISENFRDFSFVPTAGQGSDDPLVSLLKDISLAE